MQDMGTVHDLIEAKGKVGTLALDFDRQVVEAAAAYMADEDAGIGFLYSGWCQAALPHRRLANDQGWQIDGERVRLDGRRGWEPSLYFVIAHPAPASASPCRLFESTNRTVSRTEARLAFAVLTTERKAA
jgi:hypothetical protein